LTVKIMLVNGSPRKYGAVAKLLTIASKGVEDAGGTPRIIHLYDYNIRECMGCVSDDPKICRFPCIINDDFNRIGKMLLDSDGFIIGTPIYWYGVSGRLKNFIDRLTSMENMIIHAGRSLLDGKIAAVIASGNDSGSIMVISYLFTVLNSMGILIPPWALAYHHTMEDVLSDEQAVSDAYNIGMIMVRAAETMGKEQGKPWYKEIDGEKLSMLRRLAEEEARKHADQREERWRIYRGSLGENADR
jgi:multimeric flavodoxin WrbA